jgi:tetratricopeptide (TPR) repeat protein
MNGNAQSPRVVLTMIVRNEAAVIRRCIDAVRPVIDAYCIVDTGSTDATQDIARQALESLPGEIFEIPWRDFAFNRTRALELARGFGEYSLMIDADSVCETAGEFDKGILSAQIAADYFDVESTVEPITYVRPLLTSTRLPFHYRGVLHEFVDVPAGARYGGTIPGLRLVEENDGARSQNPHKYADDAVLLERALATNDEPDLTPRYLFYLAQSYRDAGDNERALATYEKRANLADGWIEERAVAWMQCGHLRRAAGLPLQDVLEAFGQAFDLVPQRAEPLYHSARVCRESGRMASAYPYATVGASLSRPVASLFLEEEVYDWRMLYELSIAADWVGRIEQGLRVSLQLLANPRLPGPERLAVERNVTLYRERVSPVAG